MRIEATASNWSDALKAALPHAAPASASDIPTLQSVRLEVDETGAYAVATDRYTLVMRKFFNTEATEHGAVLISSADVKRIISACAGWVKVSVSLSMSVDDGRVTFVTPDSTVTFAEQEGQFPAYRQLIYGAVAKLEEPEPRTSDLALNSALLAKWAKSVDRNASIQVRYTRNQGVAVIVADHLIGLQMPVRVEGFTIPDWAPQPVVKAAERVA